MPKQFSRTTSGGISGRLLKIPRNHPVQGGSVAQSVSSSSSARGIVKLTDSETYSVANT
jgi:hypothetical protein